MPRDAEILHALHATQYVCGYTHSYYRYPAATSPDLARELVMSFTSPGDLVCDPFMGGGTVGIETLAAGRRFAGGDLNELAVFVARAKMTPLSRQSWVAVQEWVNDGDIFTGVSESEAGSGGWLPSPLDAALASGRASVEVLDNAAARRVALCALLRVGQWALEARDAVPPLPELHIKLAERVMQMRTGMSALVESARDAGIRSRDLVSRRTLRCRSADGLSADRAFLVHTGKVRLIVTSPPYPGVHVLYHRWQIRGRRETAAPYWLIGAQDGHFMPYYTMGGRSDTGKRRYFENLTATFASLRPLLAPDGLVAVIVGFGEPEVQEAQFCAAMVSAGYELHEPFDAVQAQLTREVPNRRWYMRVQKHAPAREVLMFFRAT